MMNPQIAMLEEAADLLRVKDEAQAVLRHLEVKCPRTDGIYEWIRSACWSRFEAESEALADQYCDVLLDESQGDVDG